MKRKTYLEIPRDKEKEATNRKPGNCQEEGGKGKKQEALTTKSNMQV